MITLLLLVMVGCISQNTKTVQEVVSKILKSAELELLTPDSVMTLLKQGNSNFISKEFQSRAVANNVAVMVESVRNESPTLAQLEREGKIKIVGGVFDIHTGIVEFKEI